MVKFIIQNSLKKKYLNNFNLKSNSDTEILLESFQKKGPNILKDCDGMYAFFIHDFYSKKSFLARDRFGIKPLYFQNFDKNFLFSSEINL